MHRQLYPSRLLISWILATVVVKILRPVQSFQLNHYRPQYERKIPSTVSRASSSLKYAHRTSIRSSCRISPMVLHSSYIETIRCQNFGGLINGNRFRADQSDSNGESYMSDDIVIHLGDGASLVAVTGETGSGKSLLVVKVLEFIMGSKAVPSMIASGCSSAEAEIVIQLREPYLTVTKIMMEGAGLDPNLIAQSVNNDGVGTLTISRSISEETPKSSRSRSTNTRRKRRASIKSVCKLNGKQITIKAMKIVTSPLIAIVDAAAAAMALGEPKTRMNIIDTGVKGNIISRAQTAKKNYREARRNRERIERELANRVLPSSFASAIDDGNEDLLRHWLEEIDDFEERMSIFQDSILSSRGTASLLKDNVSFDDDDDGEDHIVGDQSFIEVLRRFANCSWERDASVEMTPEAISASYYSTLLDLRDGVQNLDNQSASANAACEVLSSLSSPQSAAYAIEQSRNHLFDVVAKDNGGKVSKATEKSHDLLNQLEDALNACVKYMEDDQNGLLSTLDKMRQSIHLSVEEIDIIIADWGALSRKHGINSFSMPSLQRSLRQELDGNIQAKEELPRAKKKEEETLDEFRKASEDLSEARLAVATRLSTSVTERIKSLGMDGSRFEVHLHSGTRDCADASAYGDGSILGVDDIDFRLLHRQINGRSSVMNGSSSSNSNDSSNGMSQQSQPLPSISDERGGNLEVVGSSGEKARILLAIETELPGSIATCSPMSSSVAPVAVIYDEIDAHVGGRAAVALAKLLSEQTRNTHGTDQIISITHSPSVAAVADRHIVIQKLPMNRDLDGRVEVLAEHVVGDARREELSRMASGDLASDEEGLRFAEALLRQGQGTISSISNQPN